MFKYKIDRFLNNMVFNIYYHNEKILIGIILIALVSTTLVILP